MKECWVVFCFESQRTGGSKVMGKFIVWPEHKFEGGFCVRCGQRERPAEGRSE